MQTDTTDTTEMIIPDHDAHVTRDDPRYVDSEDPRAMMRALGGEDRSSCTMDMGGWTTPWELLSSIDEEGHFLAAVQSEAIFGGGEALRCVELLVRGSEPGEWCHLRWAEPYRLYDGSVVLA